MSLDSNATTILRSELESPTVSELDSDVAGQLSDDEMSHDPTDRTEDNLSDEEMSREPQRKTCQLSDQNLEAREKTSSFQEPTLLKLNLTVPN